MQSFLAVAETGSLSAASRRLGTSQPTLGRQIRALETQLQATLFNRQSRGFSLTETGAALVEPARRMRDAVQEVALTAAGRQQDLSGTVRITASVVLSATHLPPILASIRTAEPDIALELAPSDDTRNLLFREADIAVRMYRPTQLDLITRHIGDLALGAFAARSYVARRGLPAIDTLLEHDFVGYDTSPLLIEGMQAAGVPISRDHFTTRCDDQNAYLALIRAGCGVGFAQASLLRDDPEMVEIDLGQPLPTLPVWLTAHEAMRRTPRIRRVWDMLRTGLAPLLT